MGQKFLKLTLLALAIPILFSSCATIFGKSIYPVSINTNPTGATVSITDKKNREIYNGTTPATVTLKSSAGYFSKAEYQVKLSLPGYNEKTIPVVCSLNGWYFGNILIGGLIGMLIVDPATGAMWKLDAPPINATLYNTTSALSKPTLNIMDIKDVPENLRLSLVKLK